MNASDLQASVEGSRDAGGRHSPKPRAPTAAPAVAPRMGMATEDAVAHGIRASAGVVTSAAIIMVAVFAIFALLDEIVFKMLGVGLAVAVLLDATIVRAVLLPAATKLLGDWNWYLPRWLAWLPAVGAESAEAATLPATAVSSPRALGPMTTAHRGDSGLSPQGR